MSGPDIDGVFPLLVLQTTGAEEYPVPGTINDGSTIKRAIRLFCEIGLHSRVFL